MKKSSLWIGVLSAIAAFQAPTAKALQWGYEDELREFVSIPRPQKILKNAREIDALGLMEARLDETPWSGDFWPDVKGSIADPYMETGQGIFQRNRALWSEDQSVLTRLANVFVRENRPALARRRELHDEIARNPHAISDEKIDNLSPAEKYDLLMGDKNFTLSRQTVKMVDVRADHDLIALFSGLCHGWSPASLTLPRPKHSVRLKTPFGRDVTFYPDDIKALATFLWGKTPAQNNLQVNGWKCQSGGREDEFGRRVDPRCFGSNPAFLHLVAVNQIGLNRRGFVMDRSNSAPVWNFPVYGYKMSFFNVADRFPYTGLSFEEAKVDITAKRLRDPYWYYRGPGVKALVGVSLTLYYSSEDKHPDHREYDEPRFDKLEKLTIRYDLELNEYDEIIGGEWRPYQTNFKPTVEEQRVYTHPSIVWLVPPGVTAWSVADLDVAGAPWNGQGLAPEAWRKAAVKASSNIEMQEIEGQMVKMPTPQPLGPVVNLLIELSRK